MKTQISKKVDLSLSQPYLTDAQRECLLEFAKGTLGRGGPAVVRVSYRLVGSEDLAARESATAMLRALQAHDWASTASHSAMAGASNLLLGILLHVETESGESSDHWVAMRSPFELMDWPTIVAAGKIDCLPPVELVTLFERDKKSEGR